MKICTTFRIITNQNNGNYGKIKEPQNKITKIKKIIASLLCVRITMFETTALEIIAYAFSTNLTFPRIILFVALHASLDLVLLRASLHGFMCVFSPNLTW